MAAIDLNQFGAIRPALPEPARLQRYERRAIARGHRAVREQKVIRAPLAGSIKAHRLPARGSGCIASIRASYFTAQSS